MSQATSLRGADLRAGSPGLNDPPVERRVVGLHAPSQRSAEPGAPGGWIVEAFVGYRAWRWSTNEGSITLRSVHASDPDQVDWIRGDVTHTPWPKGEPLKAKCLCGWINGGTHRISNATGGHTCGVYAWRNPPAVGAGDELLIGEVNLWGPEVHVYDRGIRAQFAQVAAIFVSRRMSKRARIAAGMAALQYQVPLVTV